DGGGAENVGERDLEKENPAQPHQLIVAKTGQSEADPDKYKKERRNFSEENENVNKTKKPPAGTVGNAGEMTTSKKKGNDRGRPGDHGSIFPEEKEGELHRAVFGVRAADQFRFRFREIEWQPVCFRVYGNNKDNERSPHWTRISHTDRLYLIIGTHNYHPY